MLPAIFPKLPGVSELQVPFSFQDVVCLPSAVNGVLEGVFLDVSSLGAVGGSGFPEPFSRAPAVPSFKIFTPMGVGAGCGFPFIVFSGLRRASEFGGSPSLE